MASSKAQKFIRNVHGKDNDMEETLQHVKRITFDLVHNKKLNKADAGKIIKKWKNAERRRLNRQILKKVKKACFNCRKPGHVLADCPNRGDNIQAIGNTLLESGNGICFKCGSTEHNVRTCMRKHVIGFPFATCFICGHQGHLSRDCEKNTNGIYPEGGNCNICGSTKHLKRDCPESVVSKSERDDHAISIGTISAMSSADLDDALEGGIRKDREKKLKRKVVVF